MPPGQRSVLLSVLSVHSARCERASHDRRMFDTSQQPLAPDGIEVPAQVDGGATILEIGQQPGAWREVANRPDGETAAFLRTIAGGPDRRVVLTGAGSSAFLGDIAAPALRRQFGRRVEAIATTDIVANPLDHLERDTPTLLVSFARSGNSPESLATTALA